LTGLLTEAYRRTSVRVLANVARATHGESRAEILGSGDHRQMFQRMTLRQQPLTFVAGGPTGARTTLAVWVNGVRWTEVPHFYDQAPGARVYTVRRSDDGVVTVTFGDGVTGARLPSGQDNVVATYRVGIGSAALLPAGRISMPLARPLGLQGAVNPVPATGADDPEPIDRARLTAPVTVRTLGRVVSVVDYEDAARTYAGIGKARVDVLWDGERSVVHVTVAGPGGALVDAASPLAADLRGALDAMRHAVTPIEVGGYEPRPFSIDARVLVAPDRLAADVLAAVRSTLTDRFAFDRQELARSLPSSTVVAVIQSVPGVVAVVMRALHPVGEPPPAGSPAVLDVLPAFAARRVGDATLPAQIIVVDPTAIALGEVGPS
jgi:predicted phage baseplate assembly protein